MLIKTKIYGSSAILAILSVIVMAVMLQGFASLSAQLELVQKEAELTASGAKHSAQQSEQSRSEVQQINDAILTTVDGIKSTNQRAQLTSKKVREISSSLQELSELIEELSEEVADQDALDILEEVSDEIADIEERTRREALPNLTASSQSIEAFSQQIVNQANKISTLNETIGQLSTQSQEAAAASHHITEQAQESLLQMLQQRTLLLGLLVALVGIAIGSGLLLMGVVVKPISKTVALMRDIADGEGDLTQRLRVEGQDEMAQIGQAFNRFVEKVQTMLAGFSSSSKELQETAQSTLGEMQSSNSSLQQQLQEIEQIATAVEQMNATSQSVASNAMDAASSTSNANDQLVLGKEAVTSAQQAVNELVSELSSTSQVVQQLEEKSLDINKVVDVITAVAEQTNLLALNAAIEAARAGEMGRGFAVVADEVRALAGKAESSANDIRTIVSEVQGMTSKAVNAMEASQRACNHTVEGSQQVFHVLNDVTQAIETIDSMNAQIASASEQETAVSADITQRIVNVNQFSHGTSKGVESTVAACEQVNSIAKHIHLQLAQFRV